MDTGLAKVGDWVGTGRLIIDLFSDKPIYIAKHPGTMLCVNMFIPVLLLIKIRNALRLTEMQKSY